MTSHAGSFLVARPILKDSSFRQSVVLLLQHTLDGAFGLVVNRPSSVDDMAFPVYAGGPCEAEGLLMLHGHADWVEGADEKTAREVARGFFLGDGGCLGHIGDAPAGKVQRYRMFNGYAGWGPRQLEGELEAGAWSLVPANGQ